MFKNLFGTSEKETTNWDIINSFEGLENAITSSHQQPVVLFKHSTRCSVSYMAKNSLQRGWSEVEGKARLFYLDLIQYRELSNHIEERFGVQHESPQLIILHEGRVIGHTSHSGVTPSFILGKVS